MTQTPALLAQQSHECAASGAGHWMSNNGLHGEVQCDYCGQSPVAPNLLDRVYEFNRIGQTVPPSGTFNADRVCFYTGMQLEEMAEKIGAIADGEVETKARGVLAALALGIDALGKEFKAGRHMGAVLRADREKLLDADIDIAVVTAGSMQYQTPHFRGATALVLDKNDAKFPNGVVTRDSNGKILKPEGWTPPDLSPFVIQPQN